MGEENRETDDRRKNAKIRDNRGGDCSNEGRGDLSER